VFNLLPGQGLGFSASQELAFGLAPVSVTEVVIPINKPSKFGPSAGGVGGFSNLSVFDNNYSRGKDDNEIIEILSIICEVLDE
jgi:hypothetical protein